MAELEKFINNDDLTVDPLVKAALAHVRFETVHPFMDGNGRLGRLLIPLILGADGLISRPLLYLSLYFKQNRTSYYDALQQVRTAGDWEGWLSFFLDGVISASNSAIATARRVVVRPKQVSGDLRISRSSTQSAIDRLVDVGILKEMTGRRRDRVYAYGDYLAILNEDTDEPLQG